LIAINPAVAPFQEIEPTRADALGVLQLADDESWRDAQPMCKSEYGSRSRRD